MNSHSFLMLGSTFIFGAFASTWAPDTTWLHYLYISLLICIPLTLIRQYIGALCISFFAGALLVISSTLGVLENHVQLPTNQRVVEAVGTVLDYPDVNVWRARFELQIISSNCKKNVYRNNEIGKEWGKISAQLGKKEIGQNGPSFGGAPCVGESGVVNWRGHHRGFSNR